MDGPMRSAADAYQRRYQHVTEDISPKKSMLVIVIVVGCFAVLWPTVFYPMLVGNANSQLQPNAMDKAAGCCDVFSETDINTIKLMTELCSSITEQTGDKPPSGKEIVSRCRKEILEKCGIDISAVLQEQIRLGTSVKQILNEVRSLNGSLCLKYHYGVSPWRLGVGHKIHVNYTTNLKQERPPNMRPDSIHPAFRERGSAIPKPPGVPSMPKKNIRTIEGRPGPVAGLRPTMGGPGHVVPPSTKGSSSSMGLLLPIYTVGIVIFFTYTLMKIIFKRDNGVHGNLYPPIDPDPRFRQEVFESERCRYKPRLSRDPSGRIVVNAMSALLDEVNQEIEARRLASQANDQAKSSQQNVANGNLTNGDLHKDQEQTSVKVLGMETTASCEGGEKWNKPVEPVVPHAVPKIEVAPPQEIYLEGALPAQSQILVTDSATVTQTTTSDTTSDPAVVLAGKMTLSVISMDNAEEDGAESEKAENGEILGVNGEDNIEEDILDESKYTTASIGTVAEHEVSDQEGTDDENGNEEVEKINELDLDTNHVEQLEEEVVEEEIVEEEVEVEEEELQEEIPRGPEENVQVQANGHRVLQQEVQEELEKEIGQTMEEEFVKTTESKSQDYEDIESSYVLVKDEPQDTKVKEEIIQEIIDSLEEPPTEDVQVKEEKNGVGDLIEVKKETQEGSNLNLNEDIIKEIIDSLEENPPNEVPVKKEVVQEVSETQEANEDVIMSTLEEKQSDVVVKEELIPQLAEDKLAISSEQETNQPTLNEEIIKEIIDSLQEKQTGDIVVKDEVTPIEDDKEIKTPLEKEPTEVIVKEGVIPEVDRDLIDQEIRKVIEDAVLERCLPIQPSGREDEETKEEARLLEENKDIESNQSEKRPEEST